MNANKRYTSGSSLVRTRKEVYLDELESHVGDFSDEVYIDLKHLTIPTIRSMIKLMADNT